MPRRFSRKLLLFGGIDVPTTLAPAIDGWQAAALLLP
jgi:hypothetical protein